MFSFLGSKFPGFAGLLVRTARYTSREDDMTECPECRRQWPGDCEQAAAVREYGICIVCCVKHEINDGFEWTVEGVKNNRAKYLAAQLRGDTDGY